MLRELFVTEVTRKPLAAAFELQRHDIVRPVIMSAPRFRIDIDPADFETVDRAGHAADFWRGQINTSTEPMIQHAIIITKPVLNEPVR